MRKLIVYTLTLLLIAIVWLMLVDSVKAGGYSYPSYSYSYPSYSYYTPTYYNVQTVYQYKEVPIYKEVTIPKYAVVPLYSVFYDPSAYPQQQAHAKAPCNGMAANAPQSAPANNAHAPTTDACAVTKAKLDRVEAQMELLLRIMGNANPNVPPPGAERVPTLPKEKAPAPPKSPPPRSKSPDVKEPTSAEVMQNGVNVLYTSCAKCHEEKKAKDNGDNFVMFKGNTVVNLTERQWAKIEREITDDKMPPKKDKDGNLIAPLPSPDKKAILDMLAMRKALVKAPE